MASRYHETYQAWQKDPESFWADAARDIAWVKAPERIFDADAGIYGRWFPDGVCNTCYNCVDHHVQSGRSGQPAIIYDSPITDVKRTYTYQDVLQEVGALGQVLLEQGVTKGDRVVIYMPMIPEAVFAMLACARIGAVHSVVFGGFAAKEVATRIDDAKPKLILSASCGIEPSRIIAYKPLLDEALELAGHQVKSCIIKQRPQQSATLSSGRDHDWDHLVENMKDRGLIADCVPVAATDPLYILYTSGTTGVPKGVVRDNGGHMVALKWTMSNIYDVEPGEVFWAASDVGWVVGHSYITYAPLLQGCAVVVFEGKPVGTPDAGAFWRVIQDHNVVSLFTAPTALRAIKKEDPNCALLQGYDLQSLRSLFLAGERADPDTINWAEQKLHIPIVDHWWQTETGWTIAGNPMGQGFLPVKQGSSTVPMPGYNIKILGDAQQELGAGEMGTICIELPMPPGALPTLWENDDRFKESYLNDFPGYYTTSDAGYKDSDGYIYIMARTDDIINVAGHRLSTGGMEEVLAAHPDVAECAVIGVADKLKGQVPMGFCVLKAGVDRPEADIVCEVVAKVRADIGPVAAFKLAYIVKRLPKTRSGKILRATMRKIVDGEAFSTPATIDDPQILDEIAQVLSR